MSIRDGKPRLVVFAGQSNMFGHTKAAGGPKPTNPNVWAWTNAAAAGTWVEVRLGAPPFNPHPSAPNSAALHFATLLQAETAGDVYLLGCPMNGSTLLSWNTASAPNMAKLLREIDFALASSRLQNAGVDAASIFLWHQGESDDAGATMVKDPKLDTLESYSAGFRQMVDTLFSQHWWRMGETRIIAGELVHAGWLSARNDFYGDSRNWRTIPGMGIASSAGLTHVGDRAHFDGEGLAGLGARMYSVLNSMTKDEAVAPGRRAQSSAGPLSSGTLS